MELGIFVFTTIRRNDIRVDPRTLLVPKSRSSLITDAARPGHVEIALDITAVDTDLFLLYSTGTMIIYDRFSL